MKTKITLLRTFSFPSFWTSLVSINPLYEYTVIHLFHPIYYTRIKGNSTSLSFLGYFSVRLLHVEWLKSWNLSFGPPLHTVTHARDRAAPGQTETVVPGYVNTEQPKRILKKKKKT